MIDVNVIFDFNLKPQSLNNNIHLILITCIIY